MNVVEAYGEDMETVYIVLVNGFQWGRGPLDASGCSSETFPTRRAALEAYDRRLGV